MSEDKREHFRVAGPFDGFRVGMLETPARIYDLSEGGCFVTSLYAGTPGEIVTLKVDLPSDGWITLQGEIRYNRVDFGFAVRFTDLTGDARARLMGLVERRRKVERLAS